MMKRQWAIFRIIAVSCVLAGLALAQNYKAQATSSAPPAAVPAAIKAVLQTQGVQVNDGQGKAFAEIWLRKDVPVTAASSSDPTINYSAIKPGTLLGVVHFDNGAGDFRGQKIAAGDYTLRYELIPSDGNHMGVSSYRDFSLLVPVADDPGPSQVLDLMPLVKLSRKSTTTGHPAVFSMIPADSSKGAAPVFFQSDEGFGAVQASLGTTGSATSMPIALVLVGHSAGQ